MEKKKKKVLILGLANSGKTSISLSMQKITNLSSYTILIPTREIEISKFEDETTEYLLWDFGGQEQYRKIYMQNMKEYIAETDEIIYVIDIQDENVYYISVVFLREILNIVKSAGYSFDVSIYFHKYDESFKPEQENVRNLIKILDEEIPKGFSYKIFHTKISTVFDKTPSSFT
ncbi:MAG: ADP-ribosylation factor-like protein [Promethearchaeota archaeon]|jgi:GTPase SAR1 family protein